MPKEYKILMSTTVSNLQNQVNEKLAEGWFLQGGVSNSAEDGNDILCQAITRGRSKE